MHEGAGIAAPADLIGKRVGIPKYHMTAAVWIRGMLEDEYGVSPREVTWCEGGEGRAVNEVDIALPPEIRRELIPGDRVLGDLVAAGELDAFVGARMPRAFANGSPGIKRLFPDYRVVEQAYYQKTGLFPIMHTVVIRGELAERHPWLLRSLYDAFCRAKAIALERMADTAALPHTLPWLTAEFEATRALMGPDPWPYGVTANRRPLEALARYAFEQGVAPRHLPIDEMFPASLRET